MSDNPLVYVGPNSFVLGLHRFKQYLAIPANIQSVMDANPALRLLFVPLEQFAAVRDTILENRPSSISHAIAQLQSDGVI